MQNSVKYFQSQIAGDDLLTLIGLNKKLGEVADLNLINHAADLGAKKLKKIIKKNTNYKNNFFWRRWQI